MRPEQMRTPYYSNRNREEAILCDASTAVAEALARTQKI